MKKVLMIAYYFPPMGMGGVQRMAKFAKYLPQFGWKPCVVTVKDTAYYAKDESLLDELKEANIYRTRSLDPLRLLGRSGQRIKKGAVKRNRGFNFLEKLNDFLNQWIYLPDSKLLWLPFALLKSVEIIKRMKIALIMTTSPPCSSHVVGFLLKKLYRMPWISDFRDNWTGGEFDRAPTFLHRKIHEILEKLILQSSDRVIGVSEFISTELQRKSRQEDSKFLTITNGYDPEDFEIAERINKNERFTITYCGTLSPVSNPQNFLIALRQIFKEKGEVKNLMRVFIVGNYYKINLPVMLKGLEEVVVPVGYVPHRENIRYLLNSNLLLLLLSDWCSEGMVTGKIFEYLASRRPILAVVPKGAAANIIRSSGRGVVVMPSDVAGIKRAVIAYFSKWQQKGKFEVENLTPLQKIEVYSRVRLTERLAQMFNEVLEDQI